jgi:hypothetical protein
MNRNFGKGRHVDSLLYLFSRTLHNRRVWLEEQEEKSLREFTVGRFPVDERHNEGSFGLIFSL